MSPGLWAHYCWCCTVFCLLAMSNLSSARSMSPSLGDNLLASDSTESTDSDSPPPLNSLNSNIEQVEAILSDLINTNTDTMLGRNSDSQTIGPERSIAAPPLDELNEAYSDSVLSDDADAEEQYFEIDGNTVVLQRSPRDSSIDDPAHRVYSQTWTYESDLNSHNVELDRLEIFETETDDSNANHQRGGGEADNNAIRDPDNTKVFKKLTIRANDLDDANSDGYIKGSPAEDKFSSSYQYTLDSSSTIGTKDNKLKGYLSDQTDDRPNDDQFSRNPSDSFSDRSLLTSGESESATSNTGRLREFSSGSSRSSTLSGGNHLDGLDGITDTERLPPARRDSFSSVEDATDNDNDSSNPYHQRQQYQSDTDRAGLHKRQPNYDGHNRQAASRGGANRRRHQNSNRDRHRDSSRRDSGGNQVDSISDSHTRRLHSDGSDSGTATPARSSSSSYSSSASNNNNNYDGTSQHSKTTSSDSINTLQRDDSSRSSLPLNLNRQNLEKSRDWERLHSGFSEHIWGKSDLFALESSQNSRTTTCPVTDGVQRVMCPSHKRGPHGRTLRVCIHTAQLCDGRPDCPMAEDEDRTGCLFYATTNLYLRKTMDILTDLSEKILLNEKAVNRRHRRRHRRKEEF